MGGSSLGPEVLAETFGRQSGWPRFHMLDSTDPAQIAAMERAIDLGKTLFIVSSKSGSTLEPNILMDYFLDRAIAEAHQQSAGLGHEGRRRDRRSLGRGRRQLRGYATRRDGDAQAAPVQMIEAVRGLRLLAAA